MPFASKAQARWAFANRDALRNSRLDVDEWASKTDFKHLPEKKAYWAIEFFKAAELSLAAKDRLLDLGGTLVGGVAGGLMANSILPYVDADPSQFARGVTTGAGTLVGSGLGRTLALHAFGHQAPQTVGQAVLGLPPVHVEKKYEKLPPTSLVSKLACTEPSDFKHGTEPDSHFSRAQLDKGVAVEKEHTDDPAVAKAIVKGHLAEFRPHGTENRYYPELEKLEEKLKTACWATEYFHLVA